MKRVKKDNVIKRDFIWTFRVFFGLCKKEDLQSYYMARSSSWASQTIIRKVTNEASVQIICILRNLAPFDRDFAYQKPTEIVIAWRFQKSPNFRTTMPILLCQPSLKLSWNADANPDVKKRLTKHGTWNFSNNNRA